MSGADVARETRRWLRFAEHDLAAAAALFGHRDIAPHEVCYLAQQAAEKAIKAAFVFEQVEFPRSHDLSLLVRQLPLEWVAPLTEAQLDSLTAWSVEARYPGSWSEPTHADAATALADAQQVVCWAQAGLARGGLVSEM